MNELHLFAGAGGGILGGQLLGHTCVCAVEIEPFCRKVLLQRQRDGHLPRFPIWDDICTFDGKPWRGKIDVVCGGFPCQDISAAGSGKGLSGKRSGLWFEMARIIGEVRPRFAFVENSPILTSRGLGIVLGDLAEMGYDAQWGVFGADDIKAHHRRKRIWILAYSMCEGLEKWNGNNSDQWKTSKQINRKNASSRFTRTIWWDDEPAVDRLVNGVADRVDRIKAAGNGQVPAVAAYAWDRLINSIANTYK